MRFLFVVAACKETHCEVFCILLVPFCSSAQYFGLFPSPFESLYSEISCSFRFCPKKATCTYSYNYSLTSLVDVRVGLTVSNG